MGTYEELKAAIQQVIRTNGNNEITGALLQNALLSIVNVVGANATFAGIATPNTNPGTADQNVFYLATEAGTYVNFGGIEINMGEAVILSNKTGNWVKTTSGFATQQQLTELESKAKDILSTCVTFGFINFDNVNGKAIVSAPIYIMDGTNEITIPNQEVSYDTLKPFAFFGYDKTEKILRFWDSRQNSINRLPLVALVGSGSTVSRIDSASIECQIDGISTESLATNAESFLRVSVPDYTVIEGGAVDDNGTLGSYAGYVYTSPIKMRKGDTISLNVTGGSGVAFIAKKVDSNYIPLVTNKMVDVAFPIGYCAEEDCEIVLSSRRASLLNNSITNVVISNSVIGQYLLSSKECGDKIEELESFLNKIDGEIISLSGTNVDPSTTPSVVDTSYDWVKGYAIATPSTNGAITYRADFLQSRLISVLPGVYEYNGYLDGTTGVIFFDKNKTPINGICPWVFTASYSSVMRKLRFVVASDTSYISVNCKTSEINNFSLVRLADFNTHTLSGSALSYGKNIFYDQASQSYLLTKEHYSVLNTKPSKLSIKFKYAENLCNIDKETPLIKIIGGTSIEARLFCTTPSESLLPQKGDITKATTIQGIYCPDFPMAVMDTKLNIYKDGAIKSTLNYGGYPYRPLLKYTPAMTIRYIKKETDNLSELTDLRLYVTGNAKAESIEIKRGQDVLYSYDLTSVSDIFYVFRDLKRDLANVNGYQFDVVFNDIEMMSIEDIVLTKSSGLPFVSSYSKDWKESGEIVYDNMPVFIESMDRGVHTLDLIYTNNLLHLYLDNDLLFREYVTDIDKIHFGYNSVKIIECSIDETNSAYCKPIVKGYSTHCLYNQPTFNWDYTDNENPGITAEQKTMFSPIGFITRLKKQFDELGYVNVSVEDVANHMLRGDNIPNKSWYLELDDIGGSLPFDKLFSHTDEDGLRMMEILKQSGVKLGFAWFFDADSELCNKVKNGTATSSELLRLSSVYNNEIILKLRAMMSSYKWTVSIHHFLNNAHISNISFDEFVTNVRDTIWWYERMFERTPMTHVVSGPNQNVSPYYSRLLPMYGIQMSTDNRDDVTLSGTKNQFVLNRSYAGSRTANPQISDYDMLVI